MCRLNDHCIYDSAEYSGRSTCTLSAPGSSGRISITVREDERLLVYDLESYMGNKPIKRPDRLLIGRVGKGVWVVVLVDLKSGSEWDKAIEQFKGVLPALGKGGDKGGEDHHNECREALPLGREHRVVAVVAGQVGKGYRKFIQRAGIAGRKRKGKRGRNIIPPWGGKPIAVVPPMSGREFLSLTDFWVQLGVLPAGGVAR